MFIVLAFIVLSALSLCSACSQLFSDSDSGGDHDASIGIDGNPGLTLDAAPGEILTKRIPIVSSDGDGGEGSGPLNTNVYLEQSLWLGFGSGGSHITGLRFVPSLPTNASITSARVQFTAKAARSDSTAVVIHASDSNFPFRTGQGELSERVALPMFRWDVAPWPAADASGASQLSPELVSLIPDTWQEEDAIVFLFVAILGQREAYAFDFETGQHAPVLVLQYRLP